MRVDSDTCLALPLVLPLGWHSNPVVMAALRGSSVSCSRTLCLAISTDVGIQPVTLHLSTRLFFFIIWALHTTVHVVPGFKGLGIELEEWQGDEIWCSHVSLPHWSLKVMRLHDMLWSQSSPKAALIKYSQPADHFRFSAAIWVNDYIRFVVVFSKHGSQTAWEVHPSLQPISFGGQSGYCSITWCHAAQNIPTI